jgi:hypothetical protein
MADFRPRVEAMMKHYDPEKLATVPVMLDRYKGKEGELLEALKKRYGPEPAAAAKQPATSPSKVPGKKAPSASPVAKKAMPTPAASAAAGNAGSTMAQRVEAMMKHYDPEKAATVPVMLDRYKGKEGELLEALKKRYGPEPATATTTTTGAVSSPAKTPMKKLPAPTGAGTTPTGAPSKSSGPSPSPAKKTLPPPAVASASTLTMAQRVEAMMKHYDPEKLATVPVMLDRYKGKEGELLEALKKRYGPEPTAVPAAQASATPPTAAPAAAATASPGATASPAKAPLKVPLRPPSKSVVGAPPPGFAVNPKDYLTRVTRFMQKYDPDKVGAVPTMIERYKGKENELLEALVKRYGPEPSLAAAPKPPTPTPPVAALPQAASPAAADAASADAAPEAAVVPTTPVRAENGPPPEPTAITAPPSSTASPVTSPQKQPPAKAPAPKAAPPSKPPTKEPVATAVSQPAVVEAAPTTPQQSDSTAVWEPRVVRMLQRYEPAKANTARPMLLKFKGREHELLAALVKRYGPEPPAPGGDEAVLADALGTEDVPPQAASPAASPREPTVASPMVGSISPLPASPAAQQPAAAGGATPVSASASASFPTPATQRSSSVIGQSPQLPQPSQPRDLATGVPPGVSAVEQLPPDVRVRRLLLRYEPSKAANADVMLATYKGREMDLIKALSARFGAEPGLDFMPYGQPITTTPTAAAQSSQSQPAASPKASTAADSLPAASTSSIIPTSPASQPPNAVAAVEPTSSMDASWRTASVEPQPAAAVNVPYGAQSIANPPYGTSQSAMPLPSTSVEASSAASASGGTWQTPSAPVAAAPPSQPPQTVQPLPPAPPPPPPPPQEPQLSPEEQRAKMVRDHIRAFCSTYAPTEAAHVNEALDRAEPGAAEELLRQLHRKHSVPLPVEEPGWIDKLRRMAMSFGVGEHYVSFLINEHGADEAVVRSELLKMLFPDFVLNVLTDENQVRGFVAERLTKFLSFFDPANVSRTGAVLLRYDSHPSPTVALGDTLLRYQGEALKSARFHTVYRDAVTGIGAKVPMMPNGKPVPGIFTPPQLVDHCGVWSTQRQRGATPNFTTQAAPVYRLASVAQAGSLTDIAGDVRADTAGVDTETQTDEPPRFRKGPGYDPDRDLRMRDALASNFAEARRLRAHDLYGTSSEQRAALNRNPILAAFESAQRSAHRRDGDDNDAEDGDFGPDPSWVPGGKCNMCPQYRRTMAELQKQVQLLQTVARLRQLDLEEKRELGDCHGCREKEQQVRKLQERLHIVRVQRDARAAGHYAYDTAPFDSTVLPQRVQIGALDMAPLAYLREPLVTSDGGEHDGNTAAQFDYESPGRPRDPSPMTSPAQLRASTIGQDGRDLLDML